MYPAYKKKFSVSVVVLALAALACGPLSIAETILGSLPTITPTITPTMFASGGETVWYVSTTGSDSNHCNDLGRPCLTIKEATRLASDGDRIEVDAGTYTPQGTVEGAWALGGHKALRIVGSGADTTIVDLSGLYNGMIITASRLQIENLTIQNGGGGDRADACLSIQNNANVTLRNVNLLRCAGTGIRQQMSTILEMNNVNVRETFDAGRLAEGTGISSGGQLTIEGGEIADNYNRGLSSWTGVLSMNGTHVQNNGTIGVVIRGTGSLTNVTINGHGNILSMNHPGLLIEGGNATLTNTNVSGNKKGIDVRSNSLLTMQNSTVSDHPLTGIIIDATSDVLIELGSEISNNGSNHAGTSFGGGIDNKGRLRIYSSLIDNNHNGGILNWDEAADLVILDSTITNNRGNLAGITNWPNATAYINRSLIADNGPNIDGIDNQADMTVINSTISGNGQSGIIARGGDLSLRFVSIIRNDRFGLTTHAGGTDVSLLRSTLIAENTQFDCNFSGAPTRSIIPLEGTNVDSDGLCEFPETFSPAQLLIGPLLDNGGETMTHALDPASEAVDIVVGFCIGEDQRTFGRPVGAACDAGAYETGASATEREESEEEPGSATTITVNIPDTPCYSGPGPEWGFVNNFSAGTHLELVGAGFTGNGNSDWVVGTHPTAANTNCWLPGDNVTTGIPLGEMRLITVPAKPTTIPTATPDDPRQPAEPTPCPLDGNGNPKC